MSSPANDRSAQLRALVIEDDPDSRDALVEVIEGEGFEAASAGNLAQARTLLRSFRPELVLVDLFLPDGSGLEMLAVPLEDDLAEPPDVIVVTGHSSVETVVDALRRGAVDYLVKPLDMARLRTVLLQTSGRQQLRGEIRELRDRLRGLGRFGAMVGASPVMQKLFDQVARVAPTDATVLILGESGTGKELVAETVHALGRRRTRPMISINCGAISANLIESELFGHERGSFTGADRVHRGHFERADGGTLFLDEIGEMPYELQVKLLRVLESGTFSRIGGDRPIKVDVRIVAASNRDLDVAVAEGRFREDLLYRLRVFPVHLPPLRDRQDDLILLVDHFLAEMNVAEGASKKIAAAALDQLRAHDWPGNVRELKHVLQRAFILSDAEIAPEALASLPAPRARAAQGEPPSKRSITIEPGMPLADAERLLVIATLELSGGDKTKTAEMLGISTKTLYSRLREYQASGHWTGASPKTKPLSEPPG
ncbi:MAG: sigma-54-dependent Fis family transcriptional regulator [Thermoanaerobaculia bacterium]|jgi:DNA-binding NtrC family response regulator|nr:sigma-54-dependent Fis family transcriptional regulator [Thermoanaerobaculia bacterium]